MLGRSRMPVEDTRMERLERWAEYADRQLKGLIEGHGLEHHEINNSIELLSTFLFSIQMDIKEIKKKLNIEEPFNPNIQ